LLAEQKKQQMMAQQQELASNIEASPTKPEIGAQKSSPLQAASPLKTEMVSNFNK